MARIEDSRASDAPKPQLARLFEAIAAIMDLDEGQNGFLALPRASGPQTLEDELDAAR
jgi:hypothetical protein